MYTFGVRSVEMKKRRCAAAASKPGVRLKILDSLKRFGVTCAIPRLGFWQRQ